MTRSVLLLLTLCTGCGSDDGGSSGSTGKNYGQHDLASLSETCEGVTGLTGQPILDAKADQVSTVLGYVTASGSKVSPTDLVVDLTWPASPVATCYPEQAGTVPTAPRVGVAGVGMHFKTADGKFDESLDATAWLPVMNGAVSTPLAVAAIPRSSLKGTWQPFPDYGAGGKTLIFVLRLQGAQSSSANGNITLNNAPVADVGAGIFASGFAMATWPVPK